MSSFQIAALLNALALVVLIVWAVVEMNAAYRKIRRPGDKREWWEL